MIISPNFKKFLKLVRAREVIDNQGLPRKLLRKFCEQNYKQARFCLGVLNTFILRVDVPNLDLVKYHSFLFYISFNKFVQFYWQKTVPNAFTNFMMGTSTRVIAQFAQHINEGN